MRIDQIGMLALSLLTGGAAPLEPVPAHLGTMALYSPDGSTHETYAISSFTVSLQPAQSADAQDPASLRSITTTLGDTTAIDPFLIAWLTGGHARRHVVFTFGGSSGAESAGKKVVYDLDASEVTSFDAAYSDGGGQASLAIDARHMMLNGNRIF